MAAIKTKYYDSTGKSYDGYNVGGKTYKDETGTQAIDKGSYVQTGDKWWQMGDAGGAEVNTPEFAGGGYGTNIKKTTTPNTEKEPQTLADYGGDYSNVLSGMAIPKYDAKNVQQYQGGINDIIEALNTYQKTDSMGKDESNARAYSQLNNMYNANLDKSMDNYNKNAVGRGMFGQLPIEALKASAISDSELDKSVAINNLSDKMYTEDYNMARQTDQDFIGQVVYCH